MKNEAQNRVKFIAPGHFRGAGQFDRKGYRRLRPLLGLIS